jgi:hypothetical protein
MMHDEVETILKIRIGLETAAQDESHAETGQKVNAESNNGGTAKPAHNSSTTRRNPRRSHSARNSPAVIQSTGDTNPQYALPDKSRCTMMDAGIAAILSALVSAVIDIRRFDEPDTSTPIAPHS